MRTAIWGAGQAGCMLKNMLPGDSELVCFIDSDGSKQDALFCGTPVLPPDMLNILEINQIWIAVLNKAAARDIKAELADLEFKGEVLDISYFIKNQDLRLASVRLAARQIKDRGVAGEIAELGVYKGDTAAQLNYLFPERKLYLFDTFEGFDERDLELERSRANKNDKKRFIKDFKDTSVGFVLNRLPYKDRAVICKGRFPESLNYIELPEKFAFVSLDPDLYASVKAGLETFYPRLSNGGVIHIHDYNSLQFPGVKLATDEFCAQNNLFVIPAADFHGSAILLKY